MLSEKSIPARERLILALDVPTVEAAKEMATALGDSVTFYKLGLELFMAGGYYELVDWLAARGKKIFADLKFFDVPNTVASAVRRLHGRHIAFATVHGNDAIMQAAAEAKGDVKILAVTVLTCLDQGDMTALGFQADPKAVVLSRARRALKLGCDGVISSGLEVADIRGEVGENFLVVVPGIRPVVNRETDDQKRTVDVEEAFRRGADYIVVGRPITRAADPKAAAADIQARIAKIFG